MSKIISRINLINKYPPLIQSLIKLFFSKEIRKQVEEDEDIS
jgi:hypothetical protein